MKMKNSKKLRTIRCSRIMKLKKNMKGNMSAKDNLLKIGYNYVKI